MGPDPTSMWGGGTGVGSGGGVEMLRQWSLCQHAHKFNQQKTTTQESWAQSNASILLTRRARLQALRRIKTSYAFKYNCRVQILTAFRKWPQTKFVLWLPLKAFKHIMVWDCTAHSKACCQGNSSLAVCLHHHHGVIFHMWSSHFTGFLLKAFCYRSESEWEREREIKKKKRGGDGARGRAWAGCCQGNLTSQWRTSLFKSF